MEIAVAASPAMAGGTAHHPQDAGFGALDRGIRTGVRVAAELDGRRRVLPEGAGGAAGPQAAACGVQFDGFRRRWGREDAQHRGV